MKFKLGILDGDKAYLDRLVSAFTNKYPDKFEIYSFTDAKVALETVEKAKIDVFIADEGSEIDPAQIPSRCGFSYFVSSADIETYQDQRAICKFQKAELIYKQILSVFSETVGDALGARSDAFAQVNTYTFVSPAGGVGSSTLAAAFAVYLARQKKRVLYLNFEKFGDSTLFFSAEGQFDFSDVIYAIKSKRTNLTIKLESATRQDSSGVYFFAPVKNPLNLDEMQDEDIKRLLDELTISGSYDCFVIDADFSFSSKMMALIKQTTSLLFVSDGSEMANAKFIRAWNSILALDQQNETFIANRAGILYNKFRNKTSRAVSDVQIKDLGGFPNFEGAGPKQLVNQLSAMDTFPKLMLE